MTAGMAAYIAKNKLRPRPEWQKNVAPTPDASNPFRIVHTQIPSASGEPQAASHDQQALPAGDDAGAAARLQSHLHRAAAASANTNPPSRERLSLEECLTAVDECGAPMVSICGGEPMLYPRSASWCAEILERGQVHLAVHQRHVHRASG